AERRGRGGPPGLERRGLRRWQWPASRSSLGRRPGLDARARCRAGRHAACPRSHCSHFLDFLEFLTIIPPVAHRPILLPVLSSTYLVPVSAPSPAACLTHTWTLAGSVHTL